MLLAPEQMVVLESDPAAARAIGRASISFYLRAPGYLANLRRLGFSDDDWADPEGAVGPPRRRHRGVRRRRRRRSRGCVEHHDAGADHVAVQVLRGDREIPITEWRELARSPALTHRPAGNLDD